MIEPTSRPDAVSGTPFGSSDAVATHLADNEAAARTSPLAFRFGMGRTAWVIVGFTAFLFVLLWGAIADQVAHDRATVLEAARTNTDNLDRAYSEHVLGTLHLLDQLLMRVRTEYQKQGAVPDLSQMIHDATALDARVLLVQVLDATGHVVVSNADPPAAATYFGDRDYFVAQARANAGDDSMFISEPMKGRITGRHTVIVLSRRLSKPNGKFGGIVYVSFDPQYLSGFFHDLVIGQKSSLAIIGRDMVLRDVMLGSGPPLQALGKSIANSALATALAKSPEGRYETVSMLDGVPRLFSYRVLPDYPLIVVAGTARDDALADFRERQSWLIAVAALLTLVFAGVALYLLRCLGEQSRGEQTLRRTQALLEESQRVAKLGYILRDVPSGRLYWSDSLFDIRRVPRRDSFTYEEAVQFIEPEDIEGYVAARTAAVAERRPFAIDVRVRRPDGTICWEHRRVHFEFDETGEPSRVLLVIQDVTEQREAEERERELERKLMHSQKLEALGTLAGGIAHDLNNTLTPIMALSKLTARRLDPDDPNRSSLETIYTASEQARDLVRRVLAFSRREKVDKKPIMLDALVGDALKLLRATVPTSIDIVSRLDAVPSVLADASQVRQIVTNLVSNAAQAIGDRLGAIAVTLRLVSRNGPDTICLSVADTGAGMDETTRRRIFEPFFTTKEVGHGTGLGLSIIAGIVADHGGRIEVTSEPGKGARFEVFFPLPDIVADAA